MKESSTIKSLFAKDRGMPKGANYPAAFEKKAFEKGKKLKNLFKGITVSGVASKLPKAAKNLGKVATVSRIARAATPIGLAASAAKVVYDVATMSPEKKAKVKKLKSTLSKTSTKDYHSDLLKMSTGGDTMLKKIPEGPKGEGLRKLKAERPDVTKKMGFAKKGKMLKATYGTMAKANVGMAAKKVREKEMMKASEGKSVRGYGAARTSGMGLQDESLPPGKSLDYYKDLM